jgi:hypothetical protein
MASPLRGPKNLFDWLDPGYYRHSRWLRRTVRQLAWGAALAGAVLVVLTFWPGRPTAYQAGPLSPAHRMFNNGCGRCHTEPFEVARRLRPADAGVHSVTDQACGQCHEGALHNEQQDHTPACADCHREHGGASLAAHVANSHCTACHANLRLKDGEPPAVQNVHSFAGDHPEFALFRAGEPRDPGRLRFNHQVHLQEGGVGGPGRRAVALDCASCHQPDPDRRSFLPINYERHCAQCHPLPAQVLGGPADEPARRAADEFARVPAPHRPPAEVRAALRERFTQFAQEHPAAVAGPGEPGRAVPGASPAGPPAGDRAAWVDGQLREAERALFDGGGGCRYCHERTDSVPAAARAGGLPELRPTNLLARWFPASRFDHDSHRLLACTECHPAPGSTTAADVLLPRIDTCRKCHNPQAGARGDCIACHRYHDRDREGNWKGKFSIPDALGPSPPGGH